MWFGWAYLYLFTGCNVSPSGAQCHARPIPEAFRADLINSARLMDPGVVLKRPGFVILGLPIGVD